MDNQKNNENPSGPNRKNSVKKRGSISRTQFPPQASAYKIFITANETSYTFEKNSYKEECLGAIIKQPEWEAIITEASRVLGGSWSKKKLRDLIKLPKWMTLLAYLALALTALYMITLYLSGTSEEDSTYLITIAIISISAGSSLAFILSIVNFTRKLPKFKSLDEYMKEDMDKYLSTVNRKYAGKIELVYMPNAKWIECNILVRQVVENNVNQIDNSNNRGSMASENLKVTRGSGQEREINAIPLQNRFLENGAKGSNNNNNANGE